MSFLSDLVKLPGILIREKTSGLKEEAKEKLAVSVSKLIVLFLLLGAAFLAVVFMSLALSNYLNIVLHSAFMGELITGGIYIVIFIIIFLLRDKAFVRKQSKHLVDGLLGSHT